jgi:hypothetical protein
MICCFTSKNRIIYIHPEFEPCYLQNRIQIQFSFPLGSKKTGYEIRKIYLFSLPTNGPEAEGYNVFRTNNINIPLACEHFPKQQ